MEGKGTAVVIYTDGGARGNPGPAGAGVVIRSDDDDNTVLFEGGFFIGRATSNVAEYRGLIEALRQARNLGADRAEVRSDSQLMVRQMTGEYRVRSPSLGELFAEAQALCGDFASVRFTHVGREHNTQADRLAARAINLARDVEDAEPAGGG